MLAPCSEIAVPPRGVEAPGARRRSVVLIADTGGDCFHVGDEAMLEANLRAIGRSAASPIIELFGRSTAEPSALQDMLAALGQADALFVSGGGNLSASWPDLVDQRIIAMREAQRRGIPVITGGQTLGPQLTAAQRLALGETFGAIEHLGVRDRPSASLALELGVRSDRLAYHVDDAFLLPGREPANRAISALLAQPFLSLTLDPFFVPAGGSDALPTFAAQLVQIAAETGLRVVFTPHVGPLGRVGTEDGAVGLALRRMLRARNVRCTVLPVMSPAETAWCAQRAALVVSSRYHPIVFGTAAGVPCLGIHTDAYTRIKLQGALAHVGLAAWTQSSEAAAAGGLLSDVRRVWQQRETLRATMLGARTQIVKSEALRWKVIEERLAAVAAPAARSAPVPWLMGWRRNTRSKGSTLEPMTTLTEQMWSDYLRDGFVHLGAVLSPTEVAALRERADDFATGRVSNPGVELQLDTGGEYAELAAPERAPLETLRYRKIQGLETDDRFSALVRHPLFLEIAARHYGPHAPVSTFRAMIMNEPAGVGTTLPWHQDGGDTWGLDRDPLVTIWVALDTATLANGCIEVVPGSHTLGLLRTFGSTLEEADVARHCVRDRVVPLEVEAGHALLMHNWLVHRSGVNPSARPRRAFTACYMDGRTVSTLTGERFPMIAGPTPEVHHFVRERLRHIDALETRVEAAENYSSSLAQDNVLLRRSRGEASAYAAGLEREMETARRLYEEADARVGAAHQFVDSLNRDNTLLRKSRDEAIAYAVSLEHELELARRAFGEAQRYAASLDAQRVARLVRSRR